MASPFPARGLARRRRIWRQALPLADAIAKMSGHTARRLRLRERGQLRQGFAADVVAFDPARIADVATYENPFQYPVGISAVIVNGRIALRDGARVGTGQGKALRPG